MVGETAISYLGYGDILMIASKDEKQYLVSIVDIPQCSCSNFTRMSSLAMGKRGQWVLCKHLYYLFRYVCKADETTDKFIHAPTFNYNEVMCLFELVVCGGACISTPG